MHMYNEYSEMPSVNVIFVLDILQGSEKLVDQIKFEVDSSWNEDTVVDMLSICCLLVVTAQQLSADHLPFARSYQLDALEMAIKQDTIVFLETSSGKTLIAIMLLHSYAHLLRKPLSSLAVFLVPTVVLVSQQAEVVEMHTDLKVGKYWGEMDVDFWNASDWKKQQDEFEISVISGSVNLVLRKENVSILIICSYSIAIISYFI
ncbi:Helicase ATP-binding domain-containing protein [Heracleum sosnowskyi]|uniref:Helicase ATP-binding domain-containing protein n=1 Tax=Heracleum sosnowskyi TaxID=360622 RepID=A0AAD8M644_9APIA|nr:Helicase ATP-binding domain-containing protein [Heracleum sosnowskyi]